MKLYELIYKMYKGELPATISFNIGFNRYTAYLHSTGKLQIEDYNQDEIILSDYNDEVELLYDLSTIKEKQNSEIIKDLKYFINHTIIAGGHGYDYKQALSALLDGSDLECVLTWYDKVLKGDE